MGHCRPLTPEYSDFMAPAVQPPPIDLVHTYRMVRPPDPAACRVSLADQYESIACKMFSEHNSSVESKRAIQRPVGCMTRVFKI